MQPDPDKPIEEMLQASAKARREAFGKDAKMPNPMRARLHDEIARRGMEKPEAGYSWLALFWPRVAVSAVLATLLVVAPLMWWRGFNRGGRVAMQTAGRERDAAAETAPAAARADEMFAKGPAAAAAVSPQVNVADNSRAKLEP